ncbi:flagellar hook-associated protein 3 [Planococcus plakortidis]|uniref:Flagellar hook-associated protein 3 n=1 Tax=Planococcus plakortidis TaxID=1038856 RepID=A0A1C7EB87_9BACL|nr:flagellar hook-associated protein FlgL [Planococcus plakortidis]ANU20998.1 flagellar hook-associated protein 3 [Planococcus plakortidis]
MRVTQQMMHQNSVHHMQQNLGRFEKTNLQASSGKMLHKPSDDPQGISKAMRLKSALSASGQFERNAGEAKLWLDETDRSVQSMISVTQRVRELGVQGANGSLSPEDRKSIASEVEVLGEQLRQFANSKVDGHYLFSGSETKTKPFPAVASFDGPTFNAAAKTVKLGDGLQLEVGILPESLIGAAGDENNLFRVVGELANSLKTDGEIDLDGIDQAMERLLTAAAENGARQNRVEATENRLLDAKLSLGSALSSIEDVDYAEILIKLKSEESIYQASLSSSAKMMQPSLMDFLR